MVKIAFQIKERIKKKLSNVSRRNGTGNENKKNIFNI